MSKSGPTLGPVDLSSDIPPVLHLVANSGTKLDLVDLSSDVPLVVASHGQEWYSVGSG